MILPEKVAVIGASGFIGSRIVELFHLGGLCDVVPVVRGVNGLSRLSRFDLDWRLADACQPMPLAKALAGCDAAIHGVVGDPHVIEAAAAALLPAAAQAGVRRVVYLSTASVHGQCPVSGTSEESELSDRQEFEYNNAKVRAERTLFRDTVRYPVELIVLRPSVVFGPRDRWVGTLVTELEQGLAWMIRDGDGICNTIYVDNLVHAIRCSLEAPDEALGRAYFVGDTETVTWRLLYEQVCGHLGLSREVIHHIAVPTFPARTTLERLDGLRATPTAQRLIEKVPSRVKGVAKGALNGLKPFTFPNPWQLPPIPSPVASREMVLLQNCTYRLPHDKAMQLLHYEPPVLFREGIDRTLAWLKWTRS
ncbi:MAG: NAD(P)-dependent oxidoreductase [Bryobacteraceae bacterium]|nr:NAD(P)-dependent oxidoreductase [Bryobacteraceae bacterium]